MKIFIPSICALALLSGCAEHEYGTTNYPRHNWFVWGNRCSGPEQTDVTNQSALIRHRAGLRIDRAMVAYEAPGYTGNATTQLTPTGTTIFGATPGAASVETGTITEKVPPTGTLVHSPSQLPSQISRSSLEAVGERGKPLAPIAAPVPGRPGYVVSPFSPKSGYIDVSGLAPGSDAKDPYTGKTFRVP